MEGGVLPKKSAHPLLPFFSPSCTITKTSTQVPRYLMVSWYSYSCRYLYRYI